MNYSTDDLNELNIWQWQDIEKQYHSTSILLGNGFSINFSNTLRYKLLYEFFSKTCSDVATNLFTEFETKNFETILESLDTSEVVCKILQVPNEKFKFYKAEIREGLINAINKMHPKAAELKLWQIKQLSEQIKKFDKIFTTNYDLFLYYIILEAKKYNDNFFIPYGNDAICFQADELNHCHIYYLHGALFLFEDEFVTYKIKKPVKGWLLDSITEQITKNKYPLFISEGKSITKLKSIRANNYLNFCLNCFDRNTDKTLIVYGQSLSEQDEHLVGIIDKHYDKVAISIRPEEWETKGQLIAEKHRLSALFKKTKFEFYDSKSLFQFEWVWPF